MTCTNAGRNSRHRLVLGSTSPGQKPLPSENAVWKEGTLPWYAWTMISIPFIMLIFLLMTMLVDALVQPSSGPDGGLKRPWIRLWKLMSHRPLSFFTRSTSGVRSVWKAFSKTQDFPLPTYSALSSMRSDLKETAFQRDRKSCKCNGCTGTIEHSPFANAQVPYATLQLGGNTPLMIGQRIFMIPQGWSIKSLCAASGRMYAERMRDHTGVTVQIFQPPIDCGHPQNFGVDH